mmetsp:Transcript_25283/g.58931  ORF Transcript_25283/g.58931 Transcript_25283/m.58931 type:complete len:235 (-) Transcript_25283:131-835(-)
MVKKMKAWPTALHAAKASTFQKIEGFSMQKRYPGATSPSETARTIAVAIIQKFVRNCISKLRSFIPRSASVRFSRFWVPPTMPSQAKAPQSSNTPTPEEPLPDFDGFATLTKTVPPTMSPTCKYSRKLYLALPSRSEPSITGTIFEDLPSVATGKETPATIDAVVQYFAVTCNAPLMTYGTCGTERRRMSSKSNMQTKPSTTLAPASMTCRNQEYSKLWPLGDLKLSTSSCKEP